MRIPLLLSIAVMLGLAIRLGGTLMRSADLTADHDAYLAHAQMIEQGEGFAGPYTHRPTAFRPPAYPIAIAAVRCIGLSVPASVAFINLGCSIAIMWLTWILCRQLELPVHVSVVATVVTTFDPLLVRYSILPMTEVPAAAMLMAAVVSLKAAELQNRTTGASCAGYYILSGLLFGIGSLVRPILLVCCGMLVLWRLILRLKSGTANCKNVTRTILPLVAAFIALSPWIIRNAVQFNKFIPATTHGGYTLALGNNPDFYRDVIEGDMPFPWPGPQLDAWQQRMIAESAAQGVTPGDEPGQDAWYYQQTVSAMRKQPMICVRACLLRLLRFCAITPGVDNGLPKAVTILIGLWYGLIWFGVVAAVVQSVENLWRVPKSVFKPDLRPQTSLADLWLIVLSFMLLHCFYWTDTRMRAPVMPSVCIIAAVGCRRLFRNSSRGLAPSTTSESQT
jgi:hypothetical protein